MDNTFIEQLRPVIASTSPMIHLMSQTAGQDSVSCFLFSTGLTGRMHVPECT